MHASNHRNFWTKSNSKMWDQLQQKFHFTKVLTSFQRDPNFPLSGDHVLDKSTPCQHPTVLCNLTQHYHILLGQTLLAVKTELIQPCSWSHKIVLDASSLKTLQKQIIVIRWRQKFYFIFCQSQSDYVMQDVTIQTTSFPGNIWSCVSQICVVFWEICVVFYK